MKKEKRQQTLKVRRMQGNILTGRPEGMDYETYREKRKEQQKQLKGRRNGYMVPVGAKLTFVD